MATIKKRQTKDGTHAYLVRIKCGYDSHNKQIERSKVFRSTKTTENARLKDIQKQADAWENEVKNGVSFAGTKSSAAIIGFLRQRSTLP